MSADQNWSRCRRHTSRSIWRHSRARLDRDADAVEVDPAVLARRRPSASAGSGWSRACGRAAIARSALAVAEDERHAVAGERRSRRPSRRASRCGRVAKSKRSSLPAASLWPPRPCAPTMCARSRRPCRRPRRRSGRSGLRRPETRATRCAMPSRSIRTGATRVGLRLGAGVALRRCGLRAEPCAARDRTAAPARLQRDQVRAARRAGS